MVERITRGLACDGCGTEDDVDRYEIRSGTVRYEVDLCPDDAETLLEIARRGRRVGTRTRAKGGLRALDELLTD